MSDYLISRSTRPQMSVSASARRLSTGAARTGWRHWSSSRLTPARIEEVDAGAVFVMIGAEPRTEWLGDVVLRDDRGFILTGREIDRAEWPLERAPLSFETSVPGVFAVGDVRHGAVMRVASAAGEGSVAVGSVHRYLADQN